MWCFLSWAVDARRSSQIWGVPICFTEVKVSSDISGCSEVKPSGGLDLSEQPRDSDISRATQRLDLFDHLDRMTRIPNVRMLPVK